MASYPEAKAAVEGLWAEELAALRDTQREAAANVREARERVTRLEGAIRDGEAELELLRGERDAMPGALVRAQLEEDQGEVLVLQGRYAGVRDRISGVSSRVEDLRDELRGLTGGDPVAYVRRVEAVNSTIQLSSDLERAVWEQHDALVAALAERLAEVSDRARPPGSSDPQRHRYLYSLRR